MFQGEILTPSGWTVPRVGEVIACMGGKGSISWKKIKKAELVESDFLHVENTYMRYGVSLDHELPAWCRSGFKVISGDKIYRLWEQSPSGQVKVQHITHRYPESKDCSRSVVKDFSLSHLGNNVVPERAISLFRRYLDYRLVYPYVYVEASGNDAPYRMCEYDAIELLTVIWSHMRNHDYTRKAKGSAPVRTYKTQGYGLLQAACFFAGITSTVKNGIVKIYCHGKKGKYAVRPVITPATRVEVNAGTGWDIDVKHPVVRLGGKVVVL